MVKNLHWSLLLLLLLLLCCGWLSKWWRCSVWNEKRFLACTFDNHECNKRFHWNRKLKCYFVVVMHRWVIIIRFDFKDRFIVIQLLVEKKHNTWNIETFIKNVMFQTKCLSLYPINNKIRCRTKWMIFFFHREREKKCYDLYKTNSSDWISKYNRIPCIKWNLKQRIINEHYIDIIE